MTALVICGRCLNGEHPHDRYVDGGGDAGCPYLVEGVGCQCPEVVHVPGPRRPHCPTCTCGRP